MLNGRKATKELLKELEQGTKPKSNADKIRAMTDKELAYWIMCPYDSPYCTGTDQCIECTLEWLKQSAEGSE
jgi:hypothetical protein